MVKYCPNVFAKWQVSVFAELLCIFTHHLLLDLRRNIPSKLYDRKVIKISVVVREVMSDAR